MGYEDEKIVEEKSKKVAEKSEEKKEEHRWIVQKELPVQQIRQSPTEKGIILDFITIEEALTELMNR